MCLVSRGREEELSLDPLLLSVGLGFSGMKTVGAYEGTEREGGRKKGKQDEMWHLRLSLSSDTCLVAVGSCRYVSSADCRQLALDPQPGIERDTEHGDRRSLSRSPTFVRVETRGKIF